MSVELKVKSKHLGQEAKIIRFEERKCINHMRKAKTIEQRDRHELDFRNLRSHRMWDVRNENRATFIARAFIKGQRYEQVEKKRNNDELFYSRILPRVHVMILKYGTYKMRFGETRVTIDDLKEWSKTE